MILFILIDLIIAWLQYVNMPLDGDLYAVVLPAPWYSDVLQNPFGLEALIEGKEYGGAGRFSAHWVQATYFKTFPFLFQYFVSPIQSIYYSSAFFKIMMHLGIVFILAAYICGDFKILRKEFLLSGCAVAPFIQSYGLYNRMGLIEKSITYVFFYIFPVLILLILLYPFYRYYLSQKQQGFSLGWYTPIWLITAWSLAFFGPMVQSLMILSGGLVILSIWTTGFFLEKDKNILQLFARPFREKFRMVGITMTCLVLFAAFGYLVGLQNSENIASLPLAEAFRKALGGISFHYIKSWHFWAIAPFLVIQLYWLFGKRDNDNLKLKKILLFSGIAIAVYMLILPLGGYRSYRPMIYRYDLLIPVTLTLVYWLIVSGNHFVRSLSKKAKPIYASFAAVLLAALFFNDIRIKSDRNDCEIEKLQQLSESTKDTLILEDDCTIMGWTIDDNYYFTEKKVKLLKIWGIVDKDVSYIQE